MLTKSQIARIEAAVPPTLVMPASVPAELAAAIDWQATPPITRLIVARLFGRAADRTAVAGAWDEVRNCGLTMREIVRTLEPGVLREWAWQKLGYANRSGVTNRLRESPNRPSGAFGPSPLGRAYRGGIHVVPRR